MALVVTLQRAAASGNVPASFVAGQVGIDEFLGVFFWRQNSGTIRKFPLNAPALSILGNNSGSAGNPTYLTGAQVLSLTGGAPLDSPVFTTSVTVPTFTTTGKISNKGYVVTAPIAAATVTVAATTSIQILNPTAALASLTLVFPASPTDGQIFTVVSTLAITTLTCSATGTTIKNAPTTAAAGAPFGFLYNASATTWFRIE